MRAPNRFAVLACAALAVATLFLAGAMLGHPGGPVPHGGAYGVLFWPVLLLDQLPASARILRTSTLHIVLLYFAGYLLAWFLASNLVAAFVRRRPR